MTSNDHDDWRLTVRFKSGEDATGIFARLQAKIAATLATRRLGDDGVLAHRDGEWLRLHAASYSGLLRAHQAIVILLGEQHADELAQHRSAQSDQWVRLELPVPEREANLVAEREGSVLWGAEADPERVQIRFEVPDHRACLAFAKELEDRGYEVHTRGSFLFLFADDTQSAHELGQELRASAPSGAQLYYMGEGPSTALF
jgi:hypothetical protein